MKYYLLILGSLLFVGHVNGQDRKFKFGISGGQSITNYLYITTGERGERSKEDLKDLNKTKLSGSVYLFSDYTLAERYSVGAGLGYFNYGMRLTSFRNIADEALNSPFKSSKTSLNNHNLTINLFTRIMLFKGLYVKPGLDLSFMVKHTQRTIIEFMDGSSTKLKQGNSPASNNIFNIFPHATAGYSFSIANQLELFLEGSFKLGLLEYNYFGSGPEISSRVYSVEMNVGLRI